MSKKTKKIKTIAVTDSSFDLTETKKRKYEIVELDHCGGCLYITIEPVVKDGKKRQELIFDITDNYIPLFKYLYKINEIVKVLYTTGFNDCYNFKQIAKRIRKELVDIYWIYRTF